MVGVRADRDKLSTQQGIAAFDHRDDVVCRQNCFAHSDACLDGAADKADWRALNGATQQRLRCCVDSLSRSARTPIMWGPQLSPWIMTRYAPRLCLERSGRERLAGG
jgi:hypothetical protein